ncbi:putative dimethylallyl tryptophan synthase [Aspergillus homomorphus CBS 101889]|uniref:Putative dimethylallyl tryptophan synthase n=1 Tax=Aspergillus homomorphus (strain CBS 101889) TaxID=1450537 RepID=A0A395HKY5_ASPHC|nr:putative dimethylallyl tryptophan synthase [Aspergillus homomorphus CBS 101889]RAL08527.1 putative dimethylallyl tryptophan synthase [Aspergillus homomorphus CBS 101889]
MSATAQKEPSFAAPEAVPSPYTSLSHALLFQNQDEHDWWHRAGPVLGQMLLNADYDVHKQYQYLAFFAHHVVPALGPAPDNPRPNLYRGVFNLEFSQNFQQAGCIIRLAFLPVSYLAGVPGRDSFNRLLAPEVLARFAQLDGIELDLQVYQQLVSELALTRQEEDRLASEGPLPPIFKTQNGIALDLRKDGKMTVKLYTFLLGKSLATATPVSTLAFNAIRRLDQGAKRFEAGLQPIQAFLDSKQGTLDEMLPAFPTAFHPRGMIQIGCDLVDISRTRFKIYLHDYIVDSNRLAELWTLDGRLKEAHCPGLDKGLEILRELWSILQVREGYHLPFACEPSKPQFYYDQQFLIVNYEIHPGDPWPRPKAYFPLFGMSENAVVDAVVAFFEGLGWTQHAGMYREHVISCFPKCDLENTTDVQFWLSFSYSPKTGPYTTVYYRRI